MDIVIATLEPASRDTLPFFAKISQVSTNRHLRQTDPVLDLLSCRYTQVDAIASLTQGSGSFYAASSQYGPVQIATKHHHGLAPQVRTSSTRGEMLVLRPHATDAPGPASCILRQAQALHLP